MARRELIQNMLAYYNERAAEYEQAYTLGTGTASITDPNVFKAEAALLTGVVGRFGQSRFVDIACGTGYWLPHYAPRCSSVVLFDQSDKMLAECERKLVDLGMADRSTLRRGDFFGYDFEQGAYDSALVGFFLSHLSEPQEAVLFDGLRKMLDSSGQFLILDSAWSELRARFNRKVEHQQRRLNDGTTFEIYKRYIGREDILSWPEKYGVIMRIEYFGPAMFAVCGEFK